MRKNIRDMAEWHGPQKAVLQAVLKSKIERKSNALAIDMSKPH